MNEFLKKTVETVRRMPDADQEDIARMMLNVANDNHPENIDPSYLHDIMESLAQMRRGEFATDAEIAARFRRFES